MININVIKFYLCNSFINLKEIKFELKIKDIVILYIKWLNFDKIRVNCVLFKYEVVNRI